MKLDGSCHCGAVTFSVESHEPVPFMRCYCAICRKTAGTGGFAPLPEAPSVTHMMLGSKPGWVEADIRPGSASADTYPDESLAEWHRRHGLSR